MMPVHRDTLNAVAMAEHDGDVVSLAKWVREGLAREDALREENAKLRKRTEFTYCAYCGEEFPIDGRTANAAVGEHIRKCPKHPMRELEAELAAASPRQAAALRLAEAAQPFATLVDTSAAQVIELRAAISACKGEANPHAQ